MWDRLTDHWLIVTLVVVELWGWQQHQLLRVNLILLGVGFLCLVGWVISRVVAYRGQNLPVPRLPDLIRHLVTTQVRTARIKTRWRLFCLDNGWGRKTGYGDRRQLRPMRLRGLVPTLNGDLSARISPALSGVDPDKVWASVDYLQRTIGCREITLREIGPGSLRINFTYGDPLGRVLPIAQLPVADKGYFAYGIRSEGNVAQIRADMHLLIGGMTGQGKSSIVWTLLADIIRQDIPVDIYVSDPKGGSEFDALSKHVGERMGRLKVRQYATNDKETGEMLKQAREALSVRQRQMKAKGWRKVTRFDERNPLVLIILDEFLSLPSVIKDGATGNFGQIMTQGRAAGYLVVGLAQIGHADVMGKLRNLFPARLSLAVPDVFTQDTFLGQGSASRGAGCHKLSEDKHRGVGYAGGEESRGFTRFRAAFCSDKRRNGKPELSDIARIAAGMMPLGMEKTLEDNSPGKKSAVYRVYSFPAEDGSRQLLYVGKSNNPQLRIEQHLTDSSEPWWGGPDNEVDPEATSIRWYKSEKLALAAEAKAIRQEGPTYNTVHNSRNQARRGKDRKKVKLTLVKPTGVDDPVETVEGPVLERRAIAPGARPVDHEGEYEQAVWGE